MSSPDASTWEGVRPAMVARQEFTVEINAPRVRVWQALTAEIGQWWLPDFHMAHPESRMVFELTPGGRVYEEGPDGSNLCWFTIAAVKPEESVHWTGAIMPPWGGPASVQSWLRLEEAAPGRTALRFTECLIGLVDEAMLTSLHEGWMMLLNDGLKKYVERGG